jgi:hypothetical protein
MAVASRGGKILHEDEAAPLPLISRTDDSPTIFLTGDEASKPVWLHVEDCRPPRKIRSHLEIRIPGSHFNRAIRNAAHRFNQSTERSKALAL